MAKFDIGHKSTNVWVTRKSIQWLVDFSLPDRVKDSLSAVEVGKLNGVFVMDFYADPLVGDVVEHRGHEWKVTGRRFVATRHLKREAKAVPTLRVEYLGEVK